MSYTIPTSLYRDGQRWCWAPYRERGVSSFVAINERQAELLREMSSSCVRGTWLRPMDIGGRDGSWHSGVLAQLARKGLVERRGGKGLGGCRPAWRYRITRKGRAIMRALTAAALLSR